MNVYILVYADKEEYMSVHKSYRITQVFDSESEAYRAKKILESDSVNSSLKFWVIRKEVY